MRSFSGITESLLFPGATGTPELVEGKSTNAGSHNVFCFYRTGTHRRYRWSTCRDTHTDTAGGPPPHRTPTGGWSRPLGQMWEAQRDMKNNPKEPHQSFYGTIKNTQLAPHHVSPVFPWWQKRIKRTSVMSQIFLQQQTESDEWWKPVRRGFTVFDEGHGQGSLHALVVHHALDGQLSEQHWREDQRAGHDGCAVALVVAG